MKHKLLGAALAACLASMPAQAADKQAYFGETHLHTHYSFDSYIFGNRNTPEDAYRFATGETISHAAGFDMKLDRPLDFQAVTDHGEYLGVIPALFDADSPMGAHPLGVTMRGANSVSERRAAFAELFSYMGKSVDDENSLYNKQVVNAAWQDIVAQAEKFNKPGTFTTFIGFEYTTTQEFFENLHRNVLFRGSAVPERPFSRNHSPNPEDLWRWMDGLRAKGMDSLAIPHNSNGSDGNMFRLSTYDGSPLTADYAAMRMRNEPLVEVTQIKGTSETHPQLSPNDEFAAFEIMPYQIGAWRASKPQGGYVREAYLNGLKLQAEGKGNPFRFGLIGASDTHNGAFAYREDTHYAKMGQRDATGQRRGSVPLSWTMRLGVAAMHLRQRLSRQDVLTQARGLPPKGKTAGYLNVAWTTHSASGLAGVWAEENTRGALFDAMRRKETFATSGPRIKLRLFGGRNWPEDILRRADMVEEAYQKGVPMGGTLTAGEGAPQFIAWASRDPLSAPLQRLQIVKGWLDAEGQTHEQVIDIACAGEAVPVAGRCPDNGASVVLETCERQDAIAADELKVIWQDAAAKPGEAAFYYLRALENPSCRWSTWDALRAGTPRNPDLPATLQERAWSSPIWVN